MKSMVGHSCPLRASDGSLFYICTITAILKNSLTSKEARKQASTREELLELYTHLYYLYIRIIGIQKLYYLYIGVQKLWESDQFGPSYLR